MPRASSVSGRSTYVFQHAHGDVFTGDGPRCWPEFGRRWMVENGFEHVRRQTGDPCGNHYPFLFLRRKC